MKIKKTMKVMRASWIEVVIICVCLAVVMTLALTSKDASATDLPPNAHKYLPALVETQKELWPDAPLPGWLGAQVHKESCITVRHSKCWNPRAELKTDREYGFGFPQITIAKNKDGSERFNVFKELQAIDPVLRKWRWEDRFDAKMQLRALLIKNKIGYDRISGAATGVDRLAFSLAGYNGGMGGVLSDRRLCQGTRGCDSTRWFGHTEKTSNKSRKPWKGYGKSAFDINREYPYTIIYKLRPLYASYF